MKKMTIQWVKLKIIKPTINNILQLFFSELRKAKIQKNIKNKAKDKGDNKSKVSAKNKGSNPAKVAEKKEKNLLFEILKDIK